MQSFSSLRSALGSIPASFPLPSHGTFNSISRYAASPGKLNLSPCLHSISLISEISRHVVDEQALQISHEPQQGGRGGG
ncbi:hypothetical protein POTOM_060580 [Populus tomentosa]|uniref:Uncharacterized protein n=1 Tax=Populus tomentosa TaxID=118781 RepID=A0A8X7XQB9_POPTO|nr:hypothetical protein POTOM_060580 [Populus tomentosa]